MVIAAQRLFLVMFSLCTVVGVYAQPLTYGGPEDDRPASIVASAQGDFLLAGYTHSFGNGKSDVWVLRVDADGDERWREYEGGTEDDWANDLLETNQGNLLLVGTRIHPQSHRRNAWILLSDKVGKTIWSRQFDTADERELKSVIPLKDGSYAAVGFVRSQAKAASDAWIIKFDASGKTIWERFLGGPGTQQVVSVAEAPGGNLVVAGYEQGETPEQKADLLLAMLDSQGQEKWRKSWGGPGNDAATKVLVTGEGELVLVGWTQAEGVGNLDGLVVRFDSSGNERWHQTYGGQGKDVFYGACFTPEGGIVATGQYQPPASPDPTCWIVNTDEMGQPRWNRFLNYGVSGMGRDVVPGKSGWVIAGDGRKKGRDDYDFILNTIDFSGNGPGWLSIHGSIADGKEKPKLAPELPVLWVTAIGISNFNEQEFNLKYANQDAFALKFQFDGMKTGLFQEVHTLSLTDEEASHARVNHALDSVAQLVKPEDLWIIYFSTHGVLDDLGNLILVPHDFDPNHPEETGWQFVDLAQTWSKAKGRKLVLLDACHSGGSGQNWLSQSLANPESLNAAAASAALKDGRITMMTSSSTNEYSYEQSSWGHSAFALALIEAFSGGADYNGDRKITLYEMNLYVVQRVQSLTQGRQNPYTPINLFGNIVIYQMR